MMTVRCLARAGVVAAAALLAAPVALKLTPLPLALLLCALWPRKLGWRFACLTALGLLLLLSAAARMLADG